MNRIKPGQLANALGITTDALRKQRMRDTSPYEYEVIEGRVLYDLDTLPQGVRDNIVKITEYIKIRNRKRSIEAEVKDRLALEHEKRITKQEHKPKKVYAYFINCNNVRPNWQPINQPEKKKDKFGYY